MKFTAVIVIVPNELEDKVIERAQLACATSGQGHRRGGYGDDFWIAFEGTQSVLLMVVGAELSALSLKELRPVLVQGTKSRGSAFAVPIEP